MVTNKKTMTTKAVQQKERQKKIDYVKTVGGIDRKQLIERGEFHLWITKTNVHSDKKKQNSKQTCRRYKFQSVAV